MTREHHASIGTTDGLTEFRCCGQSERALAESWNHVPVASNQSRETTENLLDVYNRIAGHLTDHREDQRTKTVVEGGQTQVVLLDDIEDGIRMLARHLPGIHLTSSAK